MKMDEQLYHLKRELLAEYLREKMPITTASQKPLSWWIDNNYANEEDLEPVSGVKTHPHTEFPDIKKGDDPWVFAECQDDLRETYSDSVIHNGKEWIDVDGDIVIVIRWVYPKDIFK